MAVTIRKGSVNEIDAQLVAGYNALRGQMAITATKFHADITSVTSGSASNPTVTSNTVTAANGNGTLPVLLTLCSDLFYKYNAHFGDAIAHKTADATNTLTATAPPTDLTTAVAFVNDLKAKYNAHLTQSNVHFNNDATNSVATVNATDQGTADTLANAIKAAFNAHIVSAPLGNGVNLVSA